MSVITAAAQRNDATPLVSVLTVRPSSSVQQPIGTYPEYDMCYLSRRVQCTGMLNL